MAQGKVDSNPDVLTCAWVCALESCPSWLISTLPELRLLSVGLEHAPKVLVTTAGWDRREGRTWADPWYWVDHA